MPVGVTWESVPKSSRDNCIDLVFSMETCCGFKCSLYLNPGKCPSSFDGEKGMGAAKSSPGVRKIEL